MLSRYNILERIGKGGFGVVHVAEDRTLKRKVAIKFLSEESFRKDHTRARFQREARLAASLNHPNICTVHEVGEVEPGEEMVLGGDPEVRPGTPFLVMELVTGESLARILSKGGPMPLPALLEIAVHVAEGLSEAHANSIVHRDLKPENIMVTRDGRAKILDFGMAKPLFKAGQDDPVMQTTEAYSVELTREGMVLGTVAYMSPEQASGKPVDSRSDVFSLGVVLYEMATGKQPFRGDSLTSTLAKILETEPSSLTDSRGDLPYEMSRIIHRCLRKKREDRYNDTRDLVVALTDLMRDSSSGVVRSRESDAVESGQAPMARPGTGRRLAIWSAAGAAVLLAGLGIALLVPGLLPGSRNFVPPFFQQMTFTGSASFPTLSPDGQSLAYATSRPGEGYQVVIQDLIGGQQLPIFDALWIRSLRWSPNGSELLVSGSSAEDVRQTYLVSRLGGSTRPLRYLPFVAWSPEGNRFAGVTLSGKQIWFIETSTGGTSSIDLTGSFAFIYEVDWSPTGTVLAFRTSDESGRHAIWTTTLDGGEQQTVVQEARALYSPRFSPSGDAIYYLSGDERAKELKKIEIDPTTGAPDGEPMVLLSGLQAGNQLTFSSDGKRLLYPRSTSHTNLWLMNVQADGVTTSQLTHGTFLHEAPRFSPDGTRMALIRSSRSSPNLFVMSLAERRPEQLTFLTGDIWQPVWSPDGNEIAFGAPSGDAPGVWKIDARGGTPEPFSDTSLSRDLAWAPGSSILYQRPGNSALHFLDPAGGAETPFMDDAGGGADPLMFFSWLASPEYSPDGGQVAFSCTCPDGEGLWVVSLRGSSRTMIHDDIEAMPVGWSADGTWVYALQPESRRILRIPAAGGPAETFADIPFDAVGEGDVAPDGTRVAVSVPVTQADIWIIENFDPALR